MRVSAESSNTALDHVRLTDFVLVGFLGFLLRLIVILASPDAGVFADMVDYDVRARWLLREGYLYQDAWRGPGYYILLAMLYALPGPDLLTARIGQAVIGGFAAIFTSALANSFVGRRGAVVAGTIVAIYPGLVLSSIYLITEGVFTALTVATLVLTMRLHLRRSAAAGVLVGCAALTRSLGVALIPAILTGNIIQAWRERQWRRPLLASAILVMTCLLTLSPWFWHTQRVSGAIMLDAAAAYNMLVGNNPQATGRLEITDFQRLTTTELAGSATEAEMNRRAVSSSIAWIRSNPVDWLRLVPIKIWNVWGLEGREHAWVYSVGYFGARNAATVWIWGTLLLASFPLLAVAAVIGLFRPGLTTRPTGVHIVVVLVVTTLLHVVSFGESRFHLPLVPLLAVLAVRSVGDWQGTFTIGRWAASALVVGALVVGWVQQAPALVERLTQLAAPGGWQTGFPY